MQSDLVIASDCDFDLVAGVAEEVLRIVVGQIAGIVLVNFGNDIATQQFLLGRAVHLDLEKERGKRKDGGKLVELFARGKRVVLMGQVNAYPTTCFDVSLRPGLLFRIASWKGVFSSKLCKLKN